MSDVPFWSMLIMANIYFCHDRKVWGWIWLGAAVIAMILKYNA